MFSAYVLKSISHNFYYKGHCKDLSIRIQQHNSGMTKSIRPYLPFTLIYSEQFSTEKEAIEREKYFKSAAGRRFLKTKFGPQFNARLKDHLNSPPDKHLGSPAA